MTRLAGGFIDTSSWPADRPEVDASAAYLRCFWPQAASPAPSPTTDRDDEALAAYQRKHWPRGLR